MASKAFVSKALLLSLNLLFFTLLTSIPPSAASTLPPSCKDRSLDLSLCVKVLDVLKINVNELQRCCSLIGNLVGAEADVCVCDALRLNILDLLKIQHLSLTAVLDLCKDKIPRRVQCP